MSRTTEQLRVAHHLALRAQHTSEFDAAALVRTWPQLASAALAAHQTLAGGSRSTDLIVERLALDAQSLGARVEHQPWPGKGKQDSALAQVTASLEATATMGEAASVRPDDLPEGNRLIVSTLWTTSQMIGRAARDHSFDLRNDHKSPDPARLALASFVRDTYRRFNAVEQLAASALGRPDRHDHLPTDAGTQLRRAVAVWDIEAHRALLANRSTAVLHVLSHLEAESVKAFEGFINQARDHHIIDGVTSGRLRPILHDSSMSWEHLRDAAAQFSFDSVPVPMAFINAGRDLQERFAVACRGAGPEDHPEVLHALSGHLASAVTISAAARDLIETGELRAPARAIARLMGEQYPDRLAAPVDAVAIQRGQTLRLEADARRLLDAPAQRAFIDASEAVNRAAGLDSLYRSPLPIEQPVTANNMNPSLQHDPPTLSTSSKPSSPSP